MRRRVPEAVIRTARTQAQQHPWRYIGGAVGAAALAVSGLFGGLRTAATPAPDRIDIGDTVHTDAWDVRVDRVVAVKTFDTVSLTDDSNRWIVLVATITVTADEPMPGYVLRDGLFIAPFEGQLPGNAVMALASDGSYLDELQPGVPEDIGFFWEQDGTAPIPAVVDATIAGVHHERYTLDDSLHWVADGPAASLIAPVNDRTEQPA